MSFVPSNLFWKRHSGHLALGAIAAGVVIGCFDYLPKDGQPNDENALSDAHHATDLQIADPGSDLPPRPLLWTGRESIVTDPRDCLQEIGEEDFAHYLTCCMQNAVELDAMVAGLRVAWQRGAADEGEYLKLLEQAQGCLPPRVFLEFLLRANSSLEIEEPLRSSGFTHLVYQMLTFDSLTEVDALAQAWYEHRHPDLYRGDHLLGLLRAFQGLEDEEPLYQAAATHLHGILAILDDSETNMRRQAVNSLLEIQVKYSGIQSGVREVFETVSMNSADIEAAVYWICKKRFRGHIPEEAWESAMRSAIVLHPDFFAARFAEGFGGWFEGRRQGLRFQEWLRAKDVLYLPAADSGMNVPFRADEFSTVRMM